MKSNLVAEIIGSKVKGSNQRDIIFTPENISVEMIEMMDESAFTPDATFIDLYCKSGNILKAIYKRLMTSKYMKEGELADERKRREYILKHQLFGVCADKFCWIISIRNVYGQLVETSNIKYIKGFDSMVNNDDQALLWKTLREEFNMEFQFDHVVMNPPYNKGMDLDFIDFGYKVAKKDVVAIAPAKWQTAEAGQTISSKKTNYGKFREEIVPHMKKVCFYPDCLDVFGISQADGISYFMIDKNSTYENNCIVQNKCNLQQCVNSTVVRDITRQQSLWNIGNEIVEYLGKYDKYRLTKVYERKNNTVNINKQLRQSLSGAWDWENSCIKKEYIGCGGYIFSQKGHNIGVIDKIRCLSKNEESASSTSMDVFTSDSIDECKSFYTWINSKFTRFFILINISSLTILNNNTFRFVPAPPSEQKGHPEDNWNHIYTDEELYEYFGLNKEDAKTTDGVRYRDIIESIIKERK